MNNITFALFAYNEEKRISYAIRNFIKFGEVIVFDGGSTDKTKEICEALGAKFVLRPKSAKSQVEREEVYDFVKNHISTSWLYWGFVDNIAPKSLLEKLVEVAKENKYKKVVIPLYTYLWGNTDNYAQKSFAPMFFHKDYVTFQGEQIHSLGQFRGKSDQCLILPDEEKYALRHFSTYNLDKFVSRHLYYANEEAQLKAQKGEKFNVIKMIGAMFWYCWIFRRSFKKIKMGFVVALSYAFSRFMVYSRLYEIEQGISLDLIEENYSKCKERMLQDFF